MPAALARPRKERGTTLAERAGACSLFPSESAGRVPRSGTVEGNGGPKVFVCSAAGEPASVWEGFSPMSAVTLGPFHSGGSSGRYYPIAQLGRGGMSEVYLAIARGPAGFNKLVVIKRLLAGLVTEPHFLDMFLDEARLAARLNHPNIVQTNEVGIADGKYFMAMEYLDGQPLLKIVQRLAPRPLPVAVALSVAANVCAGLHYAHTVADFSGTPLGVVHRDVSPHNIFVTYAGQVKIVDFGIAKATSRTTETQTGILKGKIAYMSPEHIGGVTLDGRSDVFSLGVVLYEALTGQRLWGTPTRDVNIVKRLVTGDVPASPRLIVPDLAEDVDRICQRALATDRDKRYASALDMQKDLEESIGRLPHRASERDVGEMVTGLFAKERLAIAAIIEKQLSLLDAASTEEFALHTLPALNVPSGVMSVTPGKESFPVLLGKWPWKISSTHRRRTILVLAGIFGVFAAFAVWAFSQGGSPRTSESAAAMVPSAATLPSAAATGPIPTNAPTADSLADATPVRSPPATVAAPPRRNPAYAYPRPIASGEPPTPPPPPAIAPRPQPVTSPTYGPLDDRH
jgi:serine/threonine protein kinase